MILMHRLSYGLLRTYANIQTIPRSFTSTQYSNDHILGFSNWGEQLNAETGAETDTSPRFLQSLYGIYTCYPQSQQATSTGHKGHADGNLRSIYTVSFFSTPVLSHIVPSINPQANINDHKFSTFLPVDKTIFIKISSVPRKISGFCHLRLQLRVRYVHSVTSEVDREVICLSLSFGRGVCLTKVKCIYYYFITHFQLSPKEHLPFRSVFTFDLRSNLIPSIPRPISKPCDICKWICSIPLSKMCLPLYRFYHQINFPLPSLQNLVANIIYTSYCACSFYTVPCK